MCFQTQQNTPKRHFQPPCRRQALKQPSSITSVAKDLRNGVPKLLRVAPQAAHTRRLHRIPWSKNSHSSTEPEPARAVTHNEGERRGREREREGKRNTQRQPARKSESKKSKPHTESKGEGMKERTHKTETTKQHWKEGQGKT